MRYTRLQATCLSIAILSGASFATSDALQEFKIHASDASSVDFFGSAVAVSGNTAIVGAHQAGTDSRGAAYLYDVTNGQEIYRLSAEDGASNDRFGISVAISGSTAIVGAHRHTGSQLFCGTAYVFDVTSGQLLFELEAADAVAGGGFGFSVAIDGDLALVGAIGADSRAGAAYLFDLTTGSQLFKLAASDAAPDDTFGLSVALHGDRAIVSAPYDSDAGTASGSAYVFDVSTGQQLFKLTASDAAADDNFGNSVAISDGVALVGSPYSGSNNSGSAYLFDLVQGQQLARITGSGAGNGANFGWSVSISGDLLIVGAPGDDDNGSGSGSAHLFDAVTGDQLDKVTADDGSQSDLFGSSVAVSGSRLVIGAMGDTDFGNASGSAYLFQFDTTPPGSVIDLHSTSHTSTWTTMTEVFMAWTAAVDDGTGIDGYSVIFDQDAFAEAPAVKTHDSTVSTYSEILATSSSAYYFHVRAVDRAGNWGDTVHAGPFVIDAEAPTNGSIQIDSGFPSTLSPIVRLNNLLASDEGSGIFQMQFSNDGSTWSTPEEWLPHRRDWDLTEYGGGLEAGTKTVYVRFIDYVGNVSEAFSDTIEFAPSAPTVSEITPNRGKRSGGNSIRVRGANLMPSTTVTFGGEPAEVTYVSPYELRVVVPAGKGLTVSASGNARRLAQEVDVIVTTHYGNATVTDGYTYVFKR